VSVGRVTDIAAVAVGVAVAVVVDVAVAVAVGVNVAMAVAVAVAVAVEVAVAVGVNVAVAVAGGVNVAVAVAVGVDVAVAVAVIVAVGVGEGVGAVPGSPIAKSPNAKVEFVLAPKLTVASVLVGVLVTLVPSGLAAQLGLRNLLMMNVVVFAPASISPGGKMPVTV
jgi:hypothetical protein